MRLLWKRFHRIVLYVGYMKLAIVTLDPRFLAMWHLGRGSGVDESRRKQRYGETAYAYPDNRNKDYLLCGLAKALTSVRAGLPPDRLGIGV